MIILNDNNSQLNIEYKVIKLNNVKQMSDLAELAAVAYPESFKQIFNMHNTVGYDYVVAAYLNNKMVGICLSVGKDKITEGTGKQEASQTMFLDYLMVHPDFRKHRIGSTLIDATCKFATQHDFKNIELICPSINSESRKNIYSKNKFLKVDAINQDSDHGFYYFRFTLDKKVRLYGKLLYTFVNDALQKGYFSFEDYRQSKISYDNLGVFSELSKITPQTIQALLNSENFDMLEEGLIHMIDYQKPAYDVSQMLKKPLLLKPSQSQIDGIYLSDSNFSSDVFNQVNDLYIDRYYARKK